MLAGVRCITIWPIDCEGLLPFHVGALIADAIFTLRCAGAGRKEALAESNVRWQEFGNGRSVLMKHMSSKGYKNTVLPQESAIRKAGSMG